MTVFIFSVVLLAVLGILIGILLGVAGKVFAVETDERVVKVRECLPGNNCGGCGYPGCDGLAEAIVAIWVSPFLCSLCFLRLCSSRYRTRATYRKPRCDFSLPT